MGAAFLLLAATLSLGAAEPAGSTFSGIRQELIVALPRLEAAARIDGVLEEPAWQAAATLLDFSQYDPVDQRPAALATRVLVWYSPSAIYFGIQAHGAPGDVRATLANRDRIETDDHVLIFLGTFNDGRQALVFGVNPLGVQLDGALVEGTRLQGGGFGGLTGGREQTDLSPDFVFQSKGRLTDFGYEVEIRIPFKSIRYQDADTQSWKINVIRRVQSSGHEDSWVPARRDAPSFLAQSGTLTGLTDLRPGLVLDLNPEATAKIDGADDGRDWRYDAGAPELGGNVRWGVTPNLTFNGTINPDFSHVEADAGQFQFDPRSAVFFAEKRPFFLDNIEQFSTPNNLIYTRRIADPLFAVKLTGKLAGMAVAALSAVDSRASGGGDRPIFNILRVQRGLGAQSRAAIVYTDRVAGDDSNRVLGGDARLVFGDLSLLLQGAVSRTNSGGDVKHAPLWQAALTRNGRYFGLRYSLRGIDPNFRAASGFVNRAGIAQAIFTNQLSLYGKPKALLEKWTGDVTLDGIWQYRNFTSRGPIQDKKLHLNNNFILKRGWRVGASLLIETFGYDEELYADYVLVREDAAGAVHYLPFAGVPSLPNVDYVITLDTPRVGGVSFNLFSLWGKDENFHEWSSANIAYLQTSAEWRPTERLRVDAGYQLQTFNRRTDGTNVARRRIPRLKVEYQVTRAIFLRVVGEYDAREQDALRDDSRTELPIAIRDPITGQYVRALARSDNLFRVDWLFSYQPNPGTVIFAGYGSTLTEPSSLRLRDLTRTSDGFFLKVSYLFRL